MRVVVTVIITTCISSIVINMHICVYTGTIVYNVYVCDFLVGWYTCTQCNVGKQLRMGCERMGENRRKFINAMRGRTAFFAFFCVQRSGMGKKRKGDEGMSRVVADKGSRLIA